MRAAGANDTIDEPMRRAPRGGLDLSGREFEALVTSELDGIVEGPRLIADEGLWATFLGREACCGGRFFLAVRSCHEIDTDEVMGVLWAAADSRSERHPAVLSPRRFGRTHRLVWVSTRAYRGDFLRATTWSRGRSADTRALEFMRHVAGPLDQIHREGLVHGALAADAFHRDVEGRVRIRHLGIDLELARALARSRPRGASSVPFLAPEVREGSEPGPESDQFAVAALFVRIVTGSVPDLESGTAWRNLPKHYRSPLRRALDPDRTRRFDTVTGLLDALTAGAAEPARSAARGAARTPRNGAPPRDADRTRRNGVPRGDARDRPTDERRPESGDDRSEPVPHDGGPDLGARLRRGRRGPSRAGPDSWAGRWLAAAAVLVLSFGTAELLNREAPGLDRAASEAPLEGSATPIPPDPSDPVSASAEDPSDAAYEMLSLPESGSTDVGVSSGASALDPRAIPPAEGAEAGPATASQATTAVSATGSSPSGSSPTGALSSERTAIEPIRPSQAEPGPSRTPLSRGSESATAAPVGPPGTLSLQTYPWGRVYLDGYYVGNSPVVELRVSPGEHVIRVERAGYRAYEEVVQVPPGGSVRRTGIELTVGGTP